MFPTLPYMHIDLCGKKEMATLKYACLYIWNKLYHIILILYLVIGEEIYIEEGRFKVEKFLVKRRPL